MIVRILTFLTVFSAVAGWQGAAYAQRCTVDAEAIVNLRDPNIGAYNLWDTVHGEVESYEGLRTGVILESNNVLGVGTYYSDDKAGDKKLLIIEAGRNGRVLWQKMHSVAALSEVVKVLPHGDGYVIFGMQQKAKQKKNVWMGFIDAAGDLKAQKTLTSRGGSLDLYDAIQETGKTSYILAVQKTEVKATPDSAVLYRVNSKGQYISETGFMIGADNRIEGLTPLDESGYMAVGYTTGADGRREGWLLKLTKDLKMQWQKNFPRGAGASLSKGIRLGNETFAAVGTAAPNTGANRAGWLITFAEDLGATVWQRYFSGSAHFDGRDLTVSEDGIISVMMDSSPSDNIGPQDGGLQSHKKFDHIRLINLNPRGVMFQSDEYMQGEGVNAYQMIKGPNEELILFGDTLMAHQMEALPGAEKVEGEEMTLKRSHEAWVVAAPRVDPYTDPCKPKKIEGLP